jgi:antitoxin (DNA-binding transcriptional repressor) of toxin-antitoxin stability system
MSHVARKTRVVSTRELSRRMSSLLDEMEAEELALIVLRYGRPAAMFVPFEENAMTTKMPRVADLQGLAASEEDEPIDDVVLDPIQREILLDMQRCTALTWRIGRVERLRPMSALLIALSRLELDGLVELHAHGGRSLTRKGRRVAAGLDSNA